MRKVKKIVMMTVAILLCLVLFSTSILSGIYAKFVIKKDAQISAYIERFGVNVYIIPNTTKLKEAGATVTPENDKNSASVTVSGLQMIPGTDLSDAIKIQFEGETKVDLRVSIDFCFKYDLNDFHVPAGMGDLNNGGKGRAFMPIGFTFGAYEGTTSRITTGFIDTYYIPPYNMKSNQDTEMYFTQKLESSLDVTSESFTSILDPSTDDANKLDYRIYKDFTVTNNTPQDVVFHPDAATTSVIDTLAFGFHWPITYELKNANISENFSYGVDSTNRIGTYLAQNASTQTISFTYTVRIEQITN